MSSVIAQVSCSGDQLENEVVKQGPPRDMESNGVLVTLAFTDLHHPGERNQQICRPLL